jgi:hypothetical protein
MNVRHWKTNAAICLLVFSTLPAYARDFSALRQRWQPEAAAQNNDQNENPRSPGDKAETQKIAGLDLAPINKRQNERQSTVDRLFSRL